MPLIVENGTAPVGADSYVSVADFATYCANIGHDLTGSAEAAQEQALRRATRYIDNTYRARFSGLRTYRRNQNLEWPRTAAFYDYGQPRGPTPYPYWFNYLSEFDQIPVDMIPPEIIASVCEAAWREVQTPGGLLPDLERGGAIKMLKAGSVAIQYADGASATTIFQEIDSVISAILTPVSRYAGRSSRG